MSNTLLEEIWDKINELNTKVKDLELWAEGIGQEVGKLISPVKSDREKKLEEDVRVLKQEVDKIKQVLEKDTPNYRQINRVIIEMGPKAIGLVDPLTGNTFCIPFNDLSEHEIAMIRNVIQNWLNACLFDFDKRNKE